MSEIRATDETLHPAAEERLQEKRQRTWSGWIAIALALVICVVGLQRSNDTLVWLGFVGGMVAGNRLPFESLTGWLPWRKDGGGG